MPDTTPPIGFTGAQTTGPDQAQGLSARPVRRPDLRVYAEYARPDQAALTKAIGRDPI